MHPGNQVGALVRIIHESGKRYDPEEIAACLPEPEPAPAPAPAAPASGLADAVPLAQLLPRDLERLAEQGAPEGSRNADAFRLAAVAVAVAAAATAAGLRVDGTPEAVLLAFAARCSPPLADREALACLQSAEEQPRSVDPGWPERLRFHLNRRAKQERHQQQQAAAAPAAPQQRRPLTMAEVGERLREAVSEGMGGADLAALVAELATASEQGSISVQRLADAIRTEQLQAVAVAAEAQQIAAERDRQEIGQLLSAHYLLPAGIAAAIETRARYLPCDGPSAVLPFLATVAGLVKLGTEVEGSAPAGYSVPVNLFACLVGRSGAKKSPVGRLLVEAPTADLRAELARANQRDREAWEEQCRDLKKGDAKPPAPHPKRLSVSDFTAEALAAQLQTQEAAGLGLLVHRDELSGLFGSLNAYRGGRGADEQQLLELFDGSGLSSLRIVGDRHYSRSQVSIWGSTQPEVLRQLVADGDASGLWARFLFVPLPERAVPLPLATSAAEVAEVEAAAATLANACRAVYRLPRQTYRLAPAAAERFAHYELNRQRAALGATIGAQSALYGKSAGKVLRLAGVLHLLQIAAGELAASSEIEPGTIERAAALVDHLDAWALSLHAEVAAGGVGQAMRTVHRAAEAAAEAIRWKDLAVRLSAKQRKEIDAATFKEAAAALAAGGYGEVEAGKRGAISYRATRALP
jgi:CRISPR-associated protein Cmr3